MNAAEKAELIIHSMQEKKAFDIVTIDVSEKTSVCDYFVIASANNPNQVHAIAEKIDEDLAKIGEEALRIEGERGTKWIAMDFSDVIVHVFEKETREDYSIEMLWNSGMNLRRHE